MLDGIRETIGVLREIMQQVRAKYQVTTATWLHKPVFTITGPVVRGTYVYMAVTTKDKIYGYVDKGVKPGKFHSGSKARGFTKEIQREMREQMPGAVVEALGQGLMIGIEAMQPA